MASIRLPSLIWTAVAHGSHEIPHHTINPALRSVLAAQRIRAYHPSRRLWQQENLSQQRYGTANEPPPHLREKDGEDAVKHLTVESGRVVVADVAGKRTSSDETVVAEVEKREPTTVDGRVAATTPVSMTDPMLDSSPTPPAKIDAHPTSPVLNTHSSDPAHPPLDPATSTSKPPPHITPLDDSHIHDDHAPIVKAPHIDLPRYTHHFDTYGLVKRLDTGGWSHQHALTVMKAMRVLLASHTNLAKDALVSKSQIENAEYRFKAACAELRTEVVTRRRREQEKLRAERAQLQHEVDIISQRLGQEIAGLKEELKGLFDDRKMAVRNELRDMEVRIQQLNYRITVQLQADAKSEVEGLRWIMTRRVIFTLGVVVLMIVGGLKLVANSMEAAAKAAGTGTGGGGVAGGLTPTEVVEAVEMGRGDGREGRDVLVREGEGGGYVSLG